MNDLINNFISLSYSGKASNSTLISISPCKLYFAIGQDQEITIFKGKDESSRIPCGSSSFVWSPDSTKFAIVSDGRIGVYRSGFNAKLDDSDLIMDEGSIVSIQWIDDSNLIVVTNLGTIKVYGSSQTEIALKSNHSLKEYFKEVNGAKYVSWGLMVFGLTSMSSTSTQALLFEFQNEKFTLCEAMALLTQPRKSMIDRIYRWMDHLMRTPDSISKPQRHLDVSPNNELMISFDLKLGLLSLYSTKNASLINSWASQEIICDPHSQDLINGAYFWTNSIFVITTSDGHLAFVPLNLLTREFTPIEQQFNEFTVALIPGDRIIICENSKVAPELLVLLQISRNELVDKYILEGDFKMALETGAQIGANTDSILKKYWKHKLDEENELDLHLLDIIKDKQWVFRICCLNSMESISLQHIRNLIQYGITQTNSLTKQDVDDELEALLNEIENIAIPKSHSSDIEVLDMYIYRKKFLNLMDLLNTFEILCGGIFSSRIAAGEELYDLFWELKDQDIVDFAFSAAQVGQVNTLEVLFTRHGESILPFRLALLDDLPFMMDPQDFAAILPKLNDNVEESWREIPWRRQDWTSDAGLQELTSIIKDSPCSQYSHRIFEYPGTSTIIAQWYYSRIKTFEVEYGLVSHAFSLLVLAKKNGIDFLNSDSKKLELACNLIYGNKQEYAIALEDLLLLTDNEALTYFLHESDSYNIVDEIVNFALPFLSIRQEGEIDCPSSLYNFLVGRATTCSSFLWLESIAKESSRIFTSNLTMQSLCIDCALASPFPPVRHEWSNILRRIEDNKMSGWDNLSFDDGSVTNSRNLNLEDFKNYIQACQIFSVHGFERNLISILNLASDNDEQVLVLKRFVRQSVIVATITVSDDTWRQLLQDLLKLNALGVLQSIPRSEIYVSVLTYALGETSTIYLI